MSITFKFLLNKRRKNSTDEYPVILRVYVHREYKEQSLNFKIHEADWDESRQLVMNTNASCKIYNARILSDKAKLEKLILLSDIESKSISAEDVIQAIYPVADKPQQAQVLNHNFIDYASKQVEELKMVGKIGNAMVYECAVNKLKEYGGARLRFKDLNYQLLTAFTNSMLQEGIKVNTVSVYMRTIRAIYNRARKEGITLNEVYPFSAYRIKNEKTINRALTLAELKDIIHLQLEEDTPIWHWRNYFLLSFYLIGINFADLLTLTAANIDNGRMVFRRKKTGKVYSIKLQEEAINILNHYYSSGGDRALPLLPVLNLNVDATRLKNDIKQATKTCNEYLVRIAGKCSIGKKLTTYYARYSWANIARSLGYSKDIIAEALGHDYGNRVTGIYLDNYSSDIIDEVNDKVIKALLS